MTQTWTFTNTATVTLTPVVFPYILTIEAYNEAGEKVKIIAQTMVNSNDITDFQTLVTDPSGTTLAAGQVFDPAAGPLVLRFTGIWTPSTLGAAYVDFPWDGKNQNAQDVSQGIYYIKISVTDAYGHVETNIQEIQLLKSAGLVRVSIYNAAGELVRRIEDPNVPSANVGLDVPDVVQVGGGATATIKVSDTQSVIWDGKNATGETVESGIYEVQLEAQKGNAFEIIESKTINVLELKGASMLTDPADPKLFPKVYPNPLVVDGSAANQAVTIEWYSSAAGGVIVKIYNIAGELIRQFDANMANKSVQWNLTSNGGNSVSGGTYVVLLQAKSADGRTETRYTKFSVIRKLQGD
jgi:flagellar hook assembly protein FlgD